MQCLITGGHGFIGSHVTRKLVERNHEVSVYDNSADLLIPPPRYYRWINGDLRDYSKLCVEICRNDKIFHLGGILGTSELFDCPHEAIQINIGGTLNVLLSAQSSHRPPTVFLATKPNQWNNMYSVTSEAIEKMGHAYREYFLLDVRILRMRNVFGPGQATCPVQKCVSHFIYNSLVGKDIEIFGTGEQIVELQYVDDVACAIVDYCIDNAKSSLTVEAVKPTRLRVNQLASRILTLTNSDSKIRRCASRRGEGNQDECLDESNTSAEDLNKLDYNLTNTIDWYRDNLLLLKKYSDDKEMARRRNA